MNTLTPGLPVEFQNNPGYIAEVKPQTDKVFTLGGRGGLVQEHWRVVVAWADGANWTEVSEGIAQPWADRAEHHAPISETEALALLAKCKAGRAAAIKEEQDARAIAKAEAEAWQQAHAGKIPTGAKAVLIAELEQDESDSMTDYFAVSTSRAIILAFSTHTKDNFQEMRNAARNHADTAYLADADGTAEHREKYSMGRGYYLKAGRSSYSSGWAVRKLPLPTENPARCLPVGEWAVPEKAAAKAPRPHCASAQGKTVGVVTISEHTHTKRGFQMWVCSLSDRVSREEYQSLLDQAKKLGGWYSRAWQGTPAGFSFKCPDKAQAFAASLAG